MARLTLLRRTVNKGPNPTTWNPLWYVTLHDDNDKVTHICAISEKNDDNALERIRTLVESGLFEIRKLDKDYLYGATKHRNR